MAVESNANMKAQVLGGLALILFTCIGAPSGFAAEEGRLLARLVPQYRSPFRPWPPCQHQRLAREEGDKESYSEKEIDELVKQAEALDVEAMYLLSRIIKPGSDGKPDWTFNDFWLEKARRAGHPIENHLQYPPEVTQRTTEERIAFAEAAARHGAGGNIALSLGVAYGLPEDAPDYFGFVPHAPSKALYWLKFAAERGNAEAADRLCAAYYYGDGTHYGVKEDYKEAQRWCIQSAISECARGAPLYLSNMYKTGKHGISRDLVESRYWLRIWRERSDRQLQHVPKQTD